MASPTTHSLLSPSSAHRWLTCTPSAVLESYEPTHTSIYAAEGTEAHELAELKLSYTFGKIGPDEYNTRFEQFKMTSKYYNEEFNEYVNDYCQKVFDIFNENNKIEPCKIYFEDRVEFSDIVPNGAGTSDVVIVGKTFVHIIDLKFGKGVSVSAVNNPQLKLYALGAIVKHIRELTCKYVRMTIIQPRIDNYSEDYISIEALNKWATEYVKPRAELAIAGKGELVSGEHCKFCKLRGKCKKLASDELEAAKAEFQAVSLDTNQGLIEPNEMSPETLSSILQIAPMFIDWFKDVENYAKKAMIEDGIKIPGYKLVEGRSVRVIANENAVVEKLRTSGFEEEKYLKPKELLGISHLEKNIGKKLFNELCGDYIIKPPGKPTLALYSDKRDPIDVKSIKLDGSEFELAEEE